MVPLAGSTHGRRLCKLPPLRSLIVCDAVEENRQQQGNETLSPLVGSVIDTPSQLAMVSAKFGDTNKRPLNSRRLSVQSLTVDMSSRDREVGGA